MGRPRKNNTGLPRCVFFRHGAYYYVKQGKWTNIGTNRERAIERAKEFEPIPVEPVVNLSMFLTAKFKTLKARPHARTGRLKAVSIDLDHVLALARATEWRCAVTGLPFTLETINGRKPYAPSIDRIDNSLDYTPGNVRIVCVAANLAMNVWGEEVLLRMTRGLLRRKDRTSGQAVQVQLDAAPDAQHSCASPGNTKESVMPRIGSPQNRIDSRSPGLRV
jgi:hypothetical protein